MSDSSPVLFKGLSFEEYVERLIFITTLKLSEVLNAAA